MFLLGYDCFLFQFPGIESRGMMLWFPALKGGWLAGSAVYPVGGSLGDGRWGSAHKVVQIMLCPLPAPCCPDLDIQSLGRKTIV